MIPHEIDLIRHIPICKTVDEIREASEKKLTSLKAKIAEREQRIADLRSEYSIDDAALVQLLTAARRADRANRMSYSYTNKTVSDKGESIEERTIGAGVVNHLLTESDFIESERASVKELELIVRNIRPLVKFSDSGNVYRQTEFPLHQEQLEYLGF